VHLGEARGEPPSVAVDRERTLGHGDRLSRPHLDDPVPADHHGVVGEHPFGVHRHDVDPDERHHVLGRRIGGGVLLGERATREGGGGGSAGASSWANEQPAKAVKATKQRIDRMAGPSGRE